MKTIINKEALQDMFYENYKEHYLDVANNGLTERKFSALLSTGVGTFTEISFDGIHIGMGELVLKQNTQIQYEAVGDNDMITMLFMLSGCTLMQYKGLGTQVALEENRHNLFFLKEEIGQKEWLVNSSEPLKALEINLSAEFFIKYFPDDGHLTNQFLNNIAKKQSSVLAKHMPVMTPSMLQIIYEILHFDRLSAVKKLFLSSKVMELLMLQIEQMQCKQESQGIAIVHKEKMFAVKDFLETKFESNFSIQSLAKDFALNEFTLKKEFKMLFGKSIFEYWNEIRFSHAKQLLKQGYAIQQLADEMGYSNSQNFSTAFKRRFGILPSAYKMRK